MFVLIAFLAILLIASDLSIPKMQDARKYLTLFVTPIQWLVDIPARTVDALSDVFIHRALLIRDNEKLRKEVLELQKKTLLFEALDEENTRMRLLLNAKDRVETPVLTVELIGLNQDPFLHEVIVNSGLEDGLKAGLPVLDAGGVAGQIVSAAHFTSRVMLITDARTAVPVVVNRSGFRTVLLGKGVFDELELNHVPSTADIQIGDLLITSGIGGRFPYGYPVAVVDNIIRDPGRSFLIVTAKPTARLDKSRHLLVLDYKPINED